MQERELLSVLRLVALALDKHPTIFAGGQRGAVARLFARLFPMFTEATRSRSSPCQITTCLASENLIASASTDGNLAQLPSFANMPFGDPRILSTDQQQQGAVGTCPQTGDVLPLLLLMYTAVCRAARALVTDVVGKIVNLVESTDDELYGQLQQGATELLLGMLSCSCVPCALCIANAPLLGLQKAFNRRGNLCPRQC